MSELSDQLKKHADTIGRCLLADEMLHNEWGKLHEVEVSLLKLAESLDRESTPEQSNGDECNGNQTKTKAEAEAMSALPESGAVHREALGLGVPEVRQVLREVDSLESTPPFDESELRKLSEQYLQNYMTQDERTKNGLPGPSSIYEHGFQDGFISGIEKRESPPRVASTPIGLRESFDNLQDYLGKIQRVIGCLCDNKASHDEDCVMNWTWGEYEYLRRHLGVTLTNEGVSANCAIKDECSAMYQTFRESRKRIAELEADLKATHASIRVMETHAPAFAKLALSERDDRIAKLENEAGRQNDLYWRERERSAELERENAELKLRVEISELCSSMASAYIESIEVLERENARLKVELEAELKQLKTNPSPSNRSEKE